MKVMRLFLAAGLFAGASAAFADEELDCANMDNATQTVMNICSYQDYQKADAELNAQYKLTMKAMKDWDAQLPENLRGGAKALLKGQRAWIDYRDGTCEVAGFSARGGSMEPLLVNSCLADITSKRTEELKQLAAGER